MGLRKLSDDTNHRHPHWMVARKVGSRPGSAKPSDHGSRRGLQIHSFLTIVSTRHDNPCSLLEYSRLMNRIVVIEDDPAIRRGLTDNLRKQSYDVLAAADGEDGYRMVCDNAP